MKEYRAIFEYPQPWDKMEPVKVGYGPARATRAEAESDRPWRPEESHGCTVGVQVREVSEWEEAK